MKNRKKIFSFIAITALLGLVASYVIKEAKKKAGGSNWFIATLKKALHGGYISDFYESETSSGISVIVFDKLPKFEHAPETVKKMINNMITTEVIENQRYQSKEEMLQAHKEHQRRTSGFLQKQFLNF